jgi:hypothetical protein
MNVRGYRCRACRGTYLNPQEDGNAYYHACPPLVHPDDVALLSDPGKVHLVRRILRPGHRDERQLKGPQLSVDYVVTPDPGLLVAEGLGVDSITVAEATAPTKGP